MTQEIKPTYVTFEQAKWLKEKGFDIECKMCVEEGDERSLPFNCGNTIHKNSLHPYYSAPEQWQVVEWLRVNHGIHIEILLEENKPWNKFYYRIMKIGQYFSLSHDGIYSETPQEAYSAAFDYILNDLI